MTIDMRKLIFALLALALLMACTPENPSPVPQAVDMGTVVNGKNVKWASSNLGASKPEEYGDYYAWGETEPKADYSWAAYKWCDGTTDILTKYNSSSSYAGTVDDITELQRGENPGETVDDVARAKLGGKWRMPTDAEWKALMETCSWEWTTRNGVKGRLVKATNGNSIFLPAAGKWDDTALGGDGSYGRYWSSSLYAESPLSAWYVFFNSAHVLGDGDGRSRGLSVRPVTE